MKKNYFFTFVFFAGIVLKSFTQSTSVGIKTGVNAAILSGTVNMETDFKPGFHLGIYFDIEGSEVVHVQPEIYFSSQGAKTTYHSGISTVETNTNLSYINVPLLMKIYAGKVFNFQLGPQLGVLISAKEKGDGINQDINEAFKPLDLSLLGGIGIDPTDHVTIGARVQYGISDIGDRENLVGMDTPPLHNRVLHFFVGFSF